MEANDLERRIREAVSRGAPVTLDPVEAGMVLEIVEAARVMFEITLDRNIARRRMEKLQVALARLGER